ncbi:hypothetical protein HMPREF3206_01681 [Fusobacterium equinum]|uniref:Uncharacterized protein n=1 Tax=Fusobacterium equinum TaxID=134605 RepID=A0A133N8W8_9FUSO|nr:hypothetical protein [Fusobacterium equinum]KXA12739.1 hypothetical protein HMPREF3206_01681 [Fusobacterium equinum]
MAQWIQDPQYREEIDEVTKELKLPVYKASAKGKFRQWFKESWNKIEDYLVNLKRSLQEQINGKEPSFYKKSGFNLEKTNLTENDSSKLFTAKGALDLFNRLTSLIAEKEPKISKLSGFNLSKSDADDLDSSSTLATSRAVKKVRDALNKLNLTWGSITNKPVFGLRVGDFMEGHRLAESLGVKEYGGLISSYGQKIAGNAYYDSNTKKMFYCKETNSYTSANSTYFEPFDNKELLNRLNNLDRKTTLRELKNSKITNNGSYVTIPEDFQLVIVFYSIGYKNELSSAVFVKGFDIDISEYGEEREIKIRLQGNKIYLWDKGKEWDANIEKIYYM